ncbi:hypothetical protein JNB_16133 [Janibacter sp. HTCC2649]|nr:hypothetical protein JNB_16133 [Janibacter sp. HTCC2649]
MGDDVAQVATPERERAPGWHARFLIAFGGAVVVVSLLLLGSLWTDGLRASTFEELRGDIRNGAVQEWYVADSLSKGFLDAKEAHQTPVEATEVTDDGMFTSTDPAGEASGGILVWRTFGGHGWQVANADAGFGSFDGHKADATEETSKLVRQLRDAGVSMRPFDWGDNTTLQNLAGFGALIVFAGLLFGAAPRVGTRWFWFWLFLNGPLAIGFIAYAVMELIGFRRRPDPPLTKRLTGITGLVGAWVLSVVLALSAAFLRSRGLQLPL